MCFAKGRWDISGKDAIKECQNAAKRCETFVNHDLLNQLKPKNLEDVLKAAHEMANTNSSHETLWIPISNYLFIFSVSHQGDATRFSENDYYCLADLAITLNDFIDHNEVKHNTQFTNICAFYLYIYHLSPLEFLKENQ